MGKHKQIQCQQCDKLIRSNNLPKHYRFHEKLWKQKKKNYFRKEPLVGEPLVGEPLQRKNELNGKFSRNHDSYSNKIVIQESQQPIVTVQQSQQIELEPTEAQNKMARLVKNFAARLVKNKKIGKHKFLTCQTCDQQFRSNNLLRHQRSHEFMKVRLENGKFSKAVRISKLKKKGKIFPQNEKKFEKPKIEKIESNEVSKKLKEYLELYQKENENVFIESNVITVDFKLKKVEDNLAGNDVPRPGKNVPRPGKKLNRNKEVTCQICNRKLRCDKLQRHLNFHKSIQFRQKNGKFLQRVLRKNNENLNILLSKKTDEIIKKSKRIFKQNKFNKDQINTNPLQQEQNRAIELFCKLCNTSDYEGNQLSQSQCCHKIFHEECLAVSIKNNPALNLNDPRFCKFDKCQKQFSCSKIDFSQFGQFTQIIQKQIDSARLDKNILKKIAKSKSDQWGQINEEEVSDSPSETFETDDEVYKQEFFSVFQQIAILGHLDVKNFSENQNEWLNEKAKLRQNLQKKILKYQRELFIQRADLGKKYLHLQNQLSVIQKESLNNFQDSVNFKRNNERDILKKIFKEKQGELLQTEDWLAHLWETKSQKGQFEKLGKVICDIIILPAFPLVFGDTNQEQNRYQNQLKVILKTNGVPVSYLFQHQKGVSVHLEESQKEFSAELLSKLNNSLKSMKSLILSKIEEKGLGERMKKQQLERIFIIQIDYTQDISGFFVSNNVQDDVLYLADVLKCDKAKGYKQLKTCFQLTKLIESADTKEQFARIKVYNKYIHLLTSGQFKKWLTMDLQKLVCPESDFYANKIQKSQNKGVSRIEISMYFSNNLDWSDQVLNQFLDAENFVKQTLQALNNMSKQFYRSVSLPETVSSYFEAVADKKVIVSFDKNLWGIGYSYSNLSYCFSGHELERTNKTGTKISFLKKFLYPNQKFIVYNEGKFVGEGIKIGNHAQLPLRSLNQNHEMIYELGLDNIFCYKVDENILSEIQIQTNYTDLQALLKFNSNLDENLNKKILGKKSKSLKKKQENQKNNQNKSSFGFSVKTQNEESWITKTKSGNILREFKEDQWECDGIVGSERNIKKTYKCLICSKSRIRSDNRKVHCCSSNILI